MTHSTTARALRAVTFGIATLALAGCSIFGGGDDEPSTPTVGNRVPILSRIVAGTEVDASIANVSVVLPPAQVNPEWAQPGGNAANSVGHLAFGNAPTLAWSASITGSTNKRRLAAAPVIGGGKLFAVDTDGTVHAFDAQTGAKAWAFRGELAKELTGSAFGGGVTYDSGRVYATNGAGDVYALDANTGGEFWRARPAGPLRGSPTVAFNAVYVMSQDNQIYALNAADGEFLWNESGSAALAGVFGVASPAAAQGTVIAGYSTGELSAYRYENGRTLWADALARTSISTQVGTLTDVDADPIIDSGYVFALGQGGRMAAYELVTGQRIWELNLAGISTPALAGEWIFTLTDDARLMAIQRATGKVRWITQLDRWKDEKDKRGAIFWTGPVLANNRLWIASSEGVVLSADAATGTTAPFTELKAGVSLPPVMANQTLYMLDDDGNIRAWR